MNDIMKKLAHLSPEKRELVLKKLEQQGLLKPSGGKSSSDHIPRAPTGTRIPLSFSQFRLWFMSKLGDEQAGQQHTYVGLRFTGKLDRNALERSLAEMMRRQSSWRTTFHEADGEPYQVVAESMRLPFENHDVSDVPEQEREEAARRIIEAAGHYYFDLSRGPLVRATRIKLAEQHHILFLYMCHIISDGWSAGIMSREFVSIYRAFAAGEPSPLADLPIRYADYAWWQRERLKGQVLERHLQFWRERLGDAQPLPALPADKTPNEIDAFEPSKLNYRIDAHITQKLNALARKRDGSLFMVLLAGLKVLLWRYTDALDVSVGTLIANRSHAQTQNILGFFLNTLVLRSDLSGRPPFLDLLQRVRETTLDAYGHQELPFEKILEDLQAQRQNVGTDLLRVMLVLQNLPISEVRLPDVTVSNYDPGIDETFAGSDLSLVIFETPDGLQISAEYNAASYEAETIRRLLDHWRYLLGAITESPETPIDRLPLADMQAAAGSTQAGEPMPDILRMFETSVKRAPNSVAVSMGDTAFTYAELNARARGIAQALRVRGVGPESHVGVALNRSPDLIAAFLGVWMAGGAYLPLDPSEPIERLAYTAADAGIAILLTQSELVGQFSGQPYQPLLVQTVKDAAGDGFAAIAAENAAYLIYTSGSTGKPKGVVVSRGSVTHYARAAVNHFNLSPSDRVLQFASIAFDTAAEEIYPCLIAGGRLEPRTDAMLDSVDDFLAACSQRKISILDLPTAFWHTMTAELEDGTHQPPEDLRLMIIGGEKADPRYLDWWRRFPDVQVMNTYGPTETTVVATICDLSQTYAGDRAPIGHAIAGVTVFVLDGAGYPTPTGVPGELTIAGPGLTRGYLGRPDLTASVFVPCPFGEGMRMYRTGDKVRRLLNGELDFLGRLDHQVKIRGYRVELGEIEATLSERDSVQDAVVVAYQKRAGEAFQLFAYVRPVAGHTVDAVRLREALGGRLPDYMVPTHITVMDVFPMTAGGKVNRRLLPIPELEGDAEAYVAPESPVEIKLAAIWRELLGVEKVGIFDNFFLLGGHSLLATRAIHRINNMFKIHLSLRDMFEDPSIANIALLIEETLLEEVAESEM